MNIRKSAAAFGALISFAAAPVFAGGLAEPIMTPVLAPAPVAEPVAPLLGWGGFYAGGQFGKVDSTTDTGSISPEVEFEFSETSFGVHVGYMYDLGNIVLAAELDYDVFTLGEGDFIVNGNQLGTFEYDEDASTARLKLRAGYNFGRFLPYATAGVARLSLDDESYNGSFYGAGVAFKATENILVGAEFLRQTFDDTDAGDVEADRLSLRGSYRF